MWILEWAVIGLLLAVLSAPLYTFYAICRRLAVRIGFVSPRGEDDLSHVGVNVGYLILHFAVTFLGICLGAAYAIFRLWDGYWPSVDVGDVFTVLRWPPIDNYTWIMEISIPQLFGFMFFVTLGCIMLLIRFDLDENPPPWFRLPWKC